MTKRISLTFTHEGKGKTPGPQKPDPCLVELVRYLARRAAERDYREMLAAEAASPDPVLDKDD